MNFISQIIGDYPNISLDIYQCDIAIHKREINILINILRNILSANEKKSYIREQKHSKTLAEYLNF